MSKSKKFFFLFLLFSFIHSFNIPIRNSTYSLKSDCFEGNNKKDKPGSINFAQDCTDYKPHRKFKCCFVHLYDSNENYCMVVKKNNKTDLNELKAFVSTKSDYAVVTCSQKNVSVNNVFLFFLLLFI